MVKKVAVFIKDNQVEGFRMAVGLTLADDEVNVFLMDKNSNPVKVLTLMWKCLATWMSRYFLIILRTSLSRRLMKRSPVP